ncbi:uncharacterized protein DUF1543 [Serratia fonticola]|uniref:Uncharacterized protein DUF1543 n=1 Tax=Serratia fonticola TaxID=47917 RepID=A0A542BPL8_SERFO|nr:DUF1543 domain-containing protein [Serratia fonticola]TQI80521.1 uncharacterized protein DUF1543 [Serratia fonticola]TQI97454.1 uncharacterized protein DUF1543 [Serratia fonticola]TVZ71951.1 uncharacterized protein DUF1543 [Serratia fonticola]
MNLYLFYLGGNAGKSNIEVHDVQFAVAEKPEDAWPFLREVWFGDKDKVHIDGYAKINWVDGYTVKLATTPPQHSEKLYFVNVGAYHPDTLAELHAFDLFIAEDARQAKARALESLLKGAILQHKDNLKEVDDCLLLEKVGSYYLHLEKNPCGSSFKPEWQGYQPIGS